MTAQEFLRWMDAAGVRFAADIVRTIGVERTTAQIWLKLAKEGDDVPIKRQFALAMSAVASGLEAWGETD